jgi:hypothetical protein
MLVRKTDFCASQKMFFKKLGESFHFMSHCKGSRQPNKFAFGTDKEAVGHSGLAAR